MKKFIAVIDYGMGNLRSVEKALQAAGSRTLITSKPGDLNRAEKLVFPGVGQFGAAMKELRERGLIEVIKNSIASGKPFLGLCLGLQLLFEKSEESPGIKGLCVLKGDVRRFKFGKKRLKIPHIGWNGIKKNSKFEIRNSKLLTGVPDNSYMYFVHSYYAKPKDKSAILTTTDYGIKFVSGIVKDNIYAFQFHPEKSQAVGLRILENFMKLKC